MKYVHPKSLMKTSAYKKIPFFSDLLRVLPGHTLPLVASNVVKVLKGLSPHCSDSKLVSCNFATGKCTEIVKFNVCNNELDLKFIVVNVIC